MKFIPGMSGMNISQDAMDKGDREMKMFTSIIRSMTKKERMLPQILDGSRKKESQRFLV